MSRSLALFAVIIWYCVSYLISRRNKQFKNIVASLGAFCEAILSQVRKLREWHNWKSLSGMLYSKFKTLIRVCRKAPATENAMFFYLILEGNKQFKLQNIVASLRAFCKAIFSRVRKWQNWKPLSVILYSKFKAL